MKTKEVEKVEVQTLFEDYAWKVNTAKSLKMWKRMNIILGLGVYLISVTVIWYMYEYKIIFIFLFSIYPFIVTIMLNMMISLLVLDPIFYRGKRAIARFIEKLSTEEKKKIIYEYFQSEVKKEQSNISYCKGKIAKLKVEISELEESIQESIEKIPQLEAKLKKL